MSTDAGLRTAEREESARRFTGRAVALLQATKARNYFQATERVSKLLQDKDFSPLRRNSEFQALLKELETEKAKSGT